MSRSVTITSRDGQEETFPCAGRNDQEVLIYAGKIVEKEGGRFDPRSAVTITRNGDVIGPPATVREMTQTTI